MNSSELLILNFYKNLIKNNLGRYISFQEFSCKILEYELIPVELHDELYKNFDLYGESFYNYLIKLLTGYIIEDYQDDLTDNCKNYLKSLSYRLKDKGLIWRRLIKDVKHERRNDSYDIQPLITEEAKSLKLSDATINIELKGINNQFMQNNNYEISKNITNEKFKNILKDFDRILIEGEAGIGKTVHLRQLVNNWSKGIWILKDEETLILKLYIKHVKLNQCVYDSLVEQNFKEIQYVDSNLIQSFLHEKHNKILILLDEADEIDKYNNELNNFIERKDIYSSIIVWCRDWKAEKIERDFQISLRIERFTIEQLRHFYETSIINPERISYFLKDLDQENWKIRDMCCIPSLSLIVYFVWSNNKYQFEENLFEFYTEIIRIIQQKNGLDKSDEIMNKIYKLSFDSLMNNKLYLTIQNNFLDEVKSYLGNIVYIQQQINQSITHFYHKSFQEYFTAKHIILQSPIIFTGKIKRMSKKSKLSYKNLMEFFIRVNKYQLFNIMDFIQQKSIVIFEKFILQFKILQIHYKTQNIIKDNYKYEKKQPKLIVNYKDFNMIIFNLLLYRIGTILTSITIDINLKNFKIINQIIIKNSKNLEILILNSLISIEKFYENSYFMEIFFLILSSIRTLNKLIWCSKSFHIVSSSINGYNNRNSDDDHDDHDDNTFIEKFEISNQFNDINEFHITIQRGSIFLKNYHDNTINFIKIINWNFIKFLKKTTNLENLTLKNKILPNLLYLDFHRFLEKKKLKLNSLLISNIILQKYGKSIIVKYDKFLKNNVSTIPNGLLESKQRKKIILINSNLNTSSTDDKFLFLTKLKNKIHTEFKNYSNINNNNFETNFFIFEEKCHQNNRKFNKEVYLEKLFHYIHPFNNFMKKNIKELLLVNINFNKISMTIDKEIWKLNSTVEKLDFSYSTFTDETFYLTFSSLKGNCPELSDIILSNCQLNEKQGNILGDLLMNLSSIRKLNLESNNQLLNGFNKILLSLNWSGQKIENINFSNCNINVEQGNLLATVLLKWFSLKSINLSYNGNLRESFYSILESLKTSNPRLEKIDFSGCNLSEKHAKLLAEILEFCTTLKKILLSYNPDVKYGFDCFIPSLIGSSSLKVIKLSGCGLNEKQGNLLAEVLENSLNVEKLFLKYNENIGDGFCQIFMTIRKLRNLKCIDLSNCKINEKQGNILGESLENNRTIKKVYLKNNSTILEGFNTLIGSLETSAGLEELDLSDCNLNGYQGELLASVMKNCSSLKKLHLKYNHNIKFNFNSVIKSLGNVKGLKHLDLSGCCLNEDCGQLLTKSIKNCHLLEIIDLSCNQNLGKSLNYIISSLKEKIHLRKINFSGCNLSELNGLNLSEILECLTSLEKISLKHNYGIKSGFNKIFSHLGKIILLKEIDVSGCNLNEEQGNLLSNVIKSNKLLEIVNLKYNKQMGMSFIPILESFSKLTKVKEIYLSGCNLMNIHGKYVSKLYRQCSSLKIIDLNFNKNLSENFNDIIQICQKLSLKEINMGNCDLNENHGNLISNLIKNCYFLEKVCLKFNTNIKNSLNEILIYSNLWKSIKELDLTGCRLEEKHGNLLSEGIKLSSNLQNLNLRYNKGIKGNFNKILKSIKLLKNLKILDLSFCNLNETQGKILSDVLKSCLSVEKVYLKYNSNIKDGFDEILRSFCSLKYLRVVDLSLCQLDERHGILLSEFMEQTISLEKLYLQSNIQIKNGFDCVIHSLKYLYNLREIDLSSCGLNYDHGKNIANAFEYFSSIERICLKNNFDLLTRLKIITLLVNYKNLPVKIEL